MIKQCCTCENVFEKATKDNCCPNCGSGNWIDGYIDDDQESEEEVTMDYYADYKEGMK